MLKGKFTTKERGVKKKRLDFLSKRALLQIYFETPIKSFPKIPIYTDIIESSNLQYLSMKIPKSSGFRGKNPHHHFFPNPQIYRF